MGKPGTGADQPLLDAVLCVPFQRPSRPTGDADRLNREVKWLSRAASQAGFELRTIQHLYDTSEQIVDRICREILHADLIVVVVAEKNANVFFEAGYALGMGKPIFYLARDEKDIPFDIGGIECFIAAELDEETCSRAANAMANCVSESSARLASGKAFAMLQAKLAKLQPKDTLLGSCLRHAFDDLADWVEGWTENSLELSGAAAILEMGCHIMGDVKHSGFATSYYSGHSSWRHSESGLSPDYFNATQQAVEDGAEVTRVYVVDSESQLAEQAFRERAWADASAGIKIKYILSSSLPDQRARDFGLWDKSLFCEVEYAIFHDGSPPQLDRCQYWSDPRHVNQGQKWQEAIEARARPCPDLPSERLLLEESAQQYVNDSDSCKRNSLSDHDCTIYHTAWQPLRMGNLVSTPGWHGEFYGNVFQQWSRLVAPRIDGTIQVLITGLADYGMLYWIAQSIGSEVRERCEFHVLDICETPLSSARWLKERLHNCEPPLDLNLICHPEDVFDNNCESNAIDLIASDAFLTRFDSMEGKQRLLEEWLDLRSSVGWIVTTARVRHGQHDIRDADREEFTVRANAAASEMDSELAAFLSEAAPEYAKYIESYPFKSETAVWEFLEDNLPPGLGHEVSFKAIPEREMAKANYACLRIGDAKRPPA